MARAKYLRVKGDKAGEEVSMPSTERTFISHDMVHHEMKWRGLV